MRVYLKVPLLMAAATTAVLADTPQEPARVPPPPISLSVTWAQPGAETEKTLMCVREGSALQCYSLDRFLQYFVERFTCVGAMPPAASQQEL